MERIPAAMRLMTPDLEPAARSAEPPRRRGLPSDLAEALANQATLAVQMARLAEGAREAAVLGERNRITRDIHDTLAQGFTGILLNLEAATMTLERGAHASAAQHVDHARRLARSCLDEARTSVRALRPPAR